MNANDLVLEVARKHCAPEWECLSELRCGTGYGDLAEQRLDAWAIRLWEKSGIKNLIRAFEVKVTKQDFLTETRNPDKRWLAKALSHEFYFVAPQGVIDKKLLAPDDGLMEWNSKELRVVKCATTRAIMPPRWNFVASVIRSLRGGADRDMSPSKQWEREKGGRE